VCQRMAENGDLTLDELCVELDGRGVTVHRSNVARLLHRLGLSHKKRHSGRASTSVPISGRRASIGPSGANRSSTRP
jgi:transposase